MESLISSTWVRRYSSRLRSSREVSVGHSLLIADDAGMACCHTGLLIALCVCGMISAGCGGRACRYESVDDVDFRSHSETQSDGPVTVSAAVLGPEQNRRRTAV